MSKQRSNKGTATTKDADAVSDTASPGEAREEKAKGRRNSTDNGERKGLDKDKPTQKDKRSKEISPGPSSVSTASSTEVSELKSMMNMIAERLGRLEVQRAPSETSTNKAPRVDSPTGKEKKGSSPASPPTTPKPAPKPSSRPASESGSKSKSQRKREKRNEKRTAKRANSALQLTKDMLGREGDDEFSEDAEAQGDVGDTSDTFSEDEHSGYDSESGDERKRKPRKTPDVVLPTRPPPDAAYSRKCTPRPGSRQIAEWIWKLKKYSTPAPTYGNEWFLPKMTDDAYSQSGSFVGWVQATIKTREGANDRNLQEALVLGKVLDALCAGDFALAAEDAARRLFAVERYAAQGRSSWLTVLSTVSAAAPVTPDEYSKYEKKVSQLEKDKERKAQQRAPQSSSRYGASTDAGKAANKESAPSRTRKDGDGGRARP